MAFVEILVRYLEALRVVWAPALVAVAALAGLQVPVVRDRAAALSGSARHLLIGAVIGFGIAWAWTLAWVCDDAFISFRYAAHLAEGQGLVWNLGERVEGFTNFLWTVLLAGAIRIGLDPVQTSVVLGLAAFAATLMVVARLLSRLRPAQGGLPWCFPLTVVVLAAHYTFASFGTSGLETMLAAGATLLAVERAVAGAPLASGLAGIAATMSHPDHCLFYAVLGVALFLEPGRRRELVRYAAPFALLYVPYFVVRWRYYGHLFPNTYYAKEGAGAYFSQGAVYLWASFLAGGLWAALPLAGYGLWRTRGTLFGRTCAMALPLYLIYVAKIGGDYMYGRLVVVLLPFFFVLAELGAVALARGRGAGWRFAALLPLVPALLPTPIIAARTIRWQMADERTHVPLVSFSPPVVGSRMFDRAQLFRSQLGDRLPVRVADLEIGMMGYYTGLEVVDCHGLTDLAVARQPLAERGRPGHEKLATPAYLRSRGVDLSRVPVFAGRYTELTRLQMPDHISYYLGRWRPDLVAALDGVPGFAAMDVTRFLDAYLAKIQDIPPAVVAEDLSAFFDPYYFAGNPDPARRQRFVQRTLAANVLPSP